MLPDDWKAKLLPRREKTFVGGNITFPSKINRWNLQEDEGEQGHVGTSMTLVAVFKRIALFHGHLRPSEREPSVGWVITSNGDI